MYDINGISGVCSTPIFRQMVVKYSSDNRQCLTHLYNKSITVINLQRIITYFKSNHNLLIQSTLCWQNSLEIKVMIIINVNESVKNKILLL
jgi:hypothetical protein